MIEILSRTKEEDPCFENAYRVVYRIKGFVGNWLIEGADTDQKALDYLENTKEDVVENAQACHLSTMGNLRLKIVTLEARGAEIDDLKQRVEQLEASVNKDLGE